MAREMKDSGIKWIGEIPNDWELSKLKYHIQVSSGEPAPEKIFDIDGDYPIYGGGDIMGHSSEFNVKCGHLLVGRVGSCGSVTCPMTDVWATDNALVIKPQLPLRYMYYLMVAANLKSLSTSNAQPLVTATKIKNVSFPLPSQVEQNAIADFLDAKCAEIDGLLADLDAEVKTLAEYKKSIIAETVTRGLNPNAQMKQSGIPWAETIPEHWTTEKFRYKLKVRRVSGHGDKQVLSVYREFGVVPKDSRDDNHNVTSEDTSKYKYVRPNDFVINKMKAWQGSMGVSEYEGIVSPAYFVYEFSDDDYNPRYFHYFMRNANNIPEYRRLSGGIREGQWDLSPYDLGNMPIIIPPKEEQDKIVIYLDEKCTAIDQSISDKQTQIETLKSYKASLIYEYVTGKKQVI